MDPGLLGYFGGMGMVRHSGRCTVRGSSLGSCFVCSSFVVVCSLSTLNWGYDAQRETIKTSGLSADLSLKFHVVSFFFPQVLVVTRNFITGALQHKIRPLKKHYKLTDKFWSLDCKISVMQESIINEHVR